MALRTLLVGLIVIATAMFVAGTAIERNASGESGHSDETTKAASATGEAGVSGEDNSEAAETPAEHANEDVGGSTATTEAPHTELRPLGVDTEAWPFVALAAAASLALAAAAWLRPRLAPLLGPVALAMLAFAVLDVREVFHQVDLAENGLALLAAGVAALHLAAAGVAAVMGAEAQRSRAGSPGAAGTMPA
jgi:hypothetical protein